MANILLGVTGSVAAVKTPDLVAGLRAAGHAVKVVATDSALYFFEPVALDPTRVLRNPDVVILDEDEWPGRGDGRRYARGDAVRHIELRRWADLLLVAPLDANTLAKFATGLCDNCLTCVWRAWDPARPTAVAPAMNTLMWDHPLTRRHLRALAADAGAGHVPGHLDGAATLAQINARSRTFRIVGPQVKVLACGDLGDGAMADVADIVAAAGELLARSIAPA
jgi:phosphopantothenoylcysteine decarboxylase